jgi:hypothetical protein
VCTSSAPTIRSDRPANTEHFTLKRLLFQRKRLHQRSSHIGQANNELFASKVWSNKSFWVIKGCWLVSMQRFLHEKGMTRVLLMYAKRMTAFEGINQKMLNLFCCRLIWLQVHPPPHSQLSMNLPYLVLSFFSRFLAGTA